MDLQVAIVAGMVFIALRNMVKDCVESRRIQAQTDLLREITMNTSRH
jgi:hypothetical protein